MKTLIPRVYGLTAEAEQRKSAAPGEKRQWDPDSFFAALAARGVADEVRVARAILDWATSRQLRIWWGEGKSDGSFLPIVDYPGGRQLTIAVLTYGRVEFQFQHMLKSGPFADEGRRLEFVRRLRAIDGIEIPDDRLHKRPSFPLTALVGDRELREFLAVLDWAVETVKSVTAT